MKKTAQALVFLTFVLPLSVWAAGSSFYVNLQDYPLYLKAGFDGSTERSFNGRDGSWREFTSWTNIIISKLPELSAEQSGGNTDNNCQ